MDRLDGFQITAQILLQMAPVWITMAIILGLSVFFRKNLGLYGRLFASPIGIIGLLLVLFWVTTAVFADMLITFDPLQQISGMKNKKPGWPVRGMEGARLLIGARASSVTVAHVAPRGGTTKRRSTCPGENGRKAPYS